MCGLKVCRNKFALITNGWLFVLEDIERPHSNLKSLNTWTKKWIHYLDSNRYLSELVPTNFQTISSHSLVTLGSPAFSQLNTTRYLYNTKPNLYEWKYSLTPAEFKHSKSWHSSSTNNIKILVIHLTHRRNSLQYYFTIHFHKKSEILIYAISNQT